LNARRWLPPLVWAGVIVLATSTPSQYVPQGVTSVDKIAHFGMYAVLGWLLTRHAAESAGRYRAVLLAAIVASGFGAVDEWHQQYIPGRSTEFADWQADSLGGVFGALAHAIFSRRRLKTSSQQ
jgi:VanZ family protein